MLLPETPHELLMVWKAVPVGHPLSQLTGLKQVAGSVAVGLAARCAQHGQGHGPVEDHGTQRMRGGERLRHRPQHEVEVTVDLFGSRQDETLGRFGFVDPGQETQGAADILMAFLGGGDRPVRPATPLFCRDPLDVVAEMLEAERLPEPIPTGRLSLRIPAQRLEGLDPQVDIPGLSGPMQSAADPVQPVESLAGAPGSEHSPGDLDRLPLRMIPQADGLDIGIDIVACIRHLGQPPGQGEPLMAPAALRLRLWDGQLLDLGFQQPAQRL